MSIKRSLPFEEWRRKVVTNITTNTSREIAKKIMNDEFFSTIRESAPFPEPEESRQARLAKHSEIQQKAERMAASWAKSQADKFDPIFQQLLARAEIEPVRNPISWITGSSTIDHEDEWVFKGWLYQAQNEHSFQRGLYSEEDVKLLIFELYDRERRRFEKLKQLHSGSAEESSGHRVRIPEKVRIEVWRRDGGKCARCGSRENLEYDHIVPVSKGGSNTARNIELLCQQCNRQKSNNIA